MKITFHQRVLLLLSGLLLLAQLANLSAVLTTTAQDTRKQLREDLLSGTQLVSQLAERRSNLLLTSAEVLAADFGFRSAIASGDEVTIQSALDNNLNRIDADLATFITLDGQQIGGAEITASEISLFQNLIQRAVTDAVTVNTLVLGGVASQVVAVPIKVPLTIGWLVLGFSLDTDVAEGFSEQVSMHVTFAQHQPQYQFFGSTLDDNQKSLLPDAMRSLHESENGQISTIDDHAFLTGLVSLGGDASTVTAILHTSLDEAMAGYRQVRKRLLIYMAVSLVVALSLGLWFARGVTRPVKLLVEAAKRIRSGDYHTPISNTTDAQRGDEFGELIGVFGEMQQGIAQREETILHQALFDDLTDLPNRRHAQNNLEKLMLPGSATHFTVILIGLDRYRQVVETLGHAVGDCVIGAIAERLRVFAPQAQLIARVSTDEFLLLVCDAPQHDAVAFCEAAIAELIRPISSAKAEVVPALSAGILKVPDNASNSSDAMRRASIALAYAREKGVATFLYEDGSDEIHVRRLSIVADLKTAVEQDQLMLHFQPKINMVTGLTESVEALVRWTHPQHGFMAPDEFIGLAEQSGNIGMLTQWVLNAVIKQLRLWDDLGIDLKAAVNLSALDIQDESLCTRIDQLLTKYHVSPKKLIIEVTESAMLKDANQALSTLNRLQTKGFTISIDDFGTGYSSLAKLKDLPIDELKIDRAFVIDIEPETPKAKIIKAIIDLGHSIGLTVITEGVETQEEWDLLGKLGNDVVQGYFISRPLPADDLTAWWMERYPKLSANAA